MGRRCVAGAELTVISAGDDLTTRVDVERSRVFSQGVDALYVDLPLDRLETAHVSDSLEQLGLPTPGYSPTIWRPATSFDCSACGRPLP